MKNTWFFSFVAGVLFSMVMVEQIAWLLVIVLVYVVVFWDEIYEGVVRMLSKNDS